MLVSLWCIFKEHTHAYLDYFFQHLKFQRGLCNFGLTYLKEKSKDFARLYHRTLKWKPFVCVWGLSSKR